MIYLFLPDAFFILVSWANKAYEFLRDIVMQLAATFHDWKGGSSGTAPYPQHALFLLPLWIIVTCKTMTKQ